MSFETFLVLSDAHPPFHDEKVWDKVVIPFAKDLQPDRVVFNGDFVDACNGLRYNMDLLMIADGKLVHEGKQYG